MITIIAEKPSVAREIAALVGANQKMDGYLKGGNYAVTWAFGHLITLAMPQEYGFEGFKRENLPILPQSHILLPKRTYDGKTFKEDTGVIKQLNVIKKLFADASEIIVATDAGREGELIFRYIYEYFSCKTPFKRLWISSLTDKAIKEGLKNLKPGQNYDSLYRAAKARSEADWLVGINSSQALSISAGRGVFSLGRVQTPTLAMICARYLENKNFTSQKFWQVKIDLSVNSIAFSMMSENKFFAPMDCQMAVDAVKSSKSAVISKYDAKEVMQDAPLLYDLTTLQKDANSKLGLSADKTLSIAQKLYEGKVISYPRTGSRFISDDVFEQILELLQGLKQYPGFEKYLSTMPAQLNPRSVNTSKVTDHHALIVTENIPSNLTGEEKQIYEMIASRMIEAFSPKCKKFVVAITAVSGGYHFDVKGSSIIEPGWRALLNEVDQDDNQINLPVLEVGEKINVSGVSSIEKKTNPKPLHTESTLLSAMETAGKELENEDEKLALKECGIGTPATRAAIIETLFSRDYIKREKKSLVPTPKGLAVYEIVKDKKIADVAMTGNWESELLKIEQGQKDCGLFENDIKQYTRDITAELLDVSISVNNQSDMKCPKCKAANISVFPKLAKCSDEACDFKIWRTIAQKEITDKQIGDLIMKGKTAVIKGFKSKAGKSFEAALVLDKDFKTTFQFK